MKMDLKTGSSLITLVKRLLDKGTATEAVVEAVGHKPSFDVMPSSDPMEACLPEEAGVSSDRVYEFLCALEDDHALDIHNVLLVRDGKVIAKTGFNGYDPDVWHAAYSESKTLTMLAVGMLFDEGLITADTRVVDIFKGMGKGGLLTPLTHKSITVAHLLSMTAGVPFGEIGAVTERDWLKCWLESQPTFEAGAKFFYNSMNSYVLSAAVKQITGQGLCEYLTPRLFEPLGIRAYYWEKCPLGIEKGGWGAFIRPEDIAKIGVMILNGGVYGGRRIISREWLDRALTVHAEVPKEYGGFDYGRHIWLSRRSGVYLINGMFGQNVLCDTTSGTVCVTNAGNCELFQQSSFFDIYDKYIRGDNDKSRARYGDYTDGRLESEPADVYERVTMLCEDASAALRRIVNNVNTVNKYALPDGVKYSGLSYSQRRLYGHIAHLNEFGATHISSPAYEVQSASEAKRTARALQYNFEMLDRKVYVTDKAEAAAVGIVPLYMQIMSNNYSGGITDIAFLHKKDGTSCGRLTLVLREGGEICGLPVGFDKPVRCEIRLGGELYKLAVKGNFAYDENGDTVLKIRLSFIEYASARYMRFVFSRGGKVTMKLSETPGRDYVEQLLRDMLTSITVGHKPSREHPIIDAAMTQLDDGYVSYRLAKLLEPELALVRKNKDNNK